MPTSSSISLPKTFFVSNLETSKVVNDEQQKESNKTKKKYSNLLKFIAEQRFINYYFPNRIFKIEQKYDSESNNKIQTLCCNKDNESKFNSQMMENESQKPYLEEEEEKNESPIFIFEEMQIEYNFSFKI